MNKKFMICLLVSIFIGIITAESIYREYRKNINSSYNAYLIQIGSYKDDDEISSNNYLVLKEDGMYNVYAGITTNLNNAVKIKSMYEHDDIHGYIKPTVINNVEFLSNLEQYDVLLSEVDNYDNLISINDIIISNYEAIVLGK